MYGSSSEVKGCLSLVLLFVVWRWKSQVTYISSISRSLLSVSISCLASRMTLALDLSMILWVNLCCSSDLMCDLWPRVEARGLGLRLAVSSLMVRGSSTGLQWSGIFQARGLLRLRGSEDKDRNRESEDTLLRSGDFLASYLVFF